jgi:AP endonuclease-1
VLETPMEDEGATWAKEIKILEGLIGADPTSPDFVKLENELAKKGAEDRKKQQEAFDKKTAKLSKVKKGGNDPKQKSIMASLIKREKK